MSGVKGLEPWREAFLGITTVERACMHTWEQVRGETGEEGGEEGRMGTREDWHPLSEMAET